MHPAADALTASSILHCEFYPVRRRTGEDYGFAIFVGRTDQRIEGERGGTFCVHGGPRRWITAQIFIWSDIQKVKRLGISRTGFNHLLNVETVRT